MLNHLSVFTLPLKLYNFCSFSIFLYFKMFSSLSSFFNKDHLSRRVLEPTEPEAENFIYRDSLDLNKNSKQKPKDADFRYVSSKPDKSGIRVKVTMTKKEAARLLSKCKEGGVLAFKDVADELVQIPVSRISVESDPGARSRAVLKSIPE